MHMGSREFAAYAQTLRRMHLAKLLDRSAELRTSNRQIDVYDMLFGDVAIEPQLADPRSGPPVAAR